MHLGVTSISSDSILASMNTASAGAQIASPYPPITIPLKLDQVPGRHRFVFDTITLDQVHPRIGDQPSQAVADNIHGVWVDFITHGQPGWAAYDITSRTTGLLAEQTDPVSDPSGDERALWDGIR